ncbi:MAG: 5-methyltetrahydrofolate--homocysteine methyltransferase [candidate division KSB1 bacterium]|nr:5-methyltetrahydrofolate--homocysteine methyltransferase [candidate division KSB1 bacterium]
MNVARLQNSGEAFRFSLLPQEALPERNRILEIIGGEQDFAPTAHAVDDALAAAEQLLHPVGGLIVFPSIDLSSDYKRCRVAEVEFDIGRIIGAQLRRSTSVAVFICTIGPEMERLAAEKMRCGDYLAGYAVDLVASEAVETAMDKIQAYLEAEQKSLGLNITNRYSPGYCGWKVDEQHKLFSLLPKGFCGISLNDSALMTPIKSVSGIIGIGKEVKRLDYACRFCDMKDCIYRRRHVPQMNDARG